MTDEKPLWDPRFTPSYTPREMLEMGVFEGKYINAISKSKKIPPSWFKIKKVLKRTDDPDPTVNKFGVKSRLSLKEWESRGWIDEEDPNGWFEWYISYFLGRRIPEVDSRQIGRWRSYVARHQGQITSNCKLNDNECRPRQRQGLLQWAWDSEQEYKDETRRHNLLEVEKREPKFVNVQQKSFDW